MAVRGKLAKEEVTQTLLKTFEGSFLWNDGKEIRIPIMEGPDLVQIKITLTAAKENVAAGAPKAEQTEAAAPVGIEMTEEEKAEVKRLMEILC